MRVLVTGATGFIGRPLVDVLMRQGDRVSVAVRDARASFPERVEVWRYGDLSAPVDWGRMLAGIEGVVHLAGIAHAGPGIGERTYDRVNHRATAELAMAAREAGVRRFVFISSVRAQSGPAADHVLTEVDDPRPTDAYGASKLAGEIAVETEHLPYAILRPALVYGPGVKGNFAALAHLAARALPLPFGALSNRRSLLNLDGMMSAIFFALHDPKAVNQTFLVADPSPISVADIVASLRRGLGRPPGLLSVPRPLLSAALRLAGKTEILERLQGALVVNPAKLIAAGWVPPPDTATSLAAMARQLVGNN